MGENKSKNIKIGIGINPDKRKKTFETGNSDELTILHIEPNCGIQVEKQFHKHFDFCRIKNKNEWFYPDEKLLFIIQLLINFNENRDLRCGKTWYQKCFSKVSQISLLEDIYSMPAYSDIDVLSDYPDFKKMIQSYKPNGYKRILHTGEVCKRENCPYGGWNLDLECCGFAYDVDKRKEILCVHPSEVIGIKDEETI